MEYVVGFLGDDYVLGRTFKCADFDQAIETLKLLLEENNEPEKLAQEIACNMELNGWSTFPIEHGTYFIGGLETP